MKKATILALAWSACFTVNACQVVLENDTDTWVAVTDLEANHPTELVKRKIKINANKNPEIHADLRVMIGPSASPSRGVSDPNQPSQEPIAKESYHIKQIACSTSHIIPITASSIRNGTLDPNIFTVEKERMLTKRLKGE